MCLDISGVKPPTSLKRSAIRSITATSCSFTASKLSRPIAHAPGEFRFRHQRQSCNRSARSTCSSVGYCIIFSHYLALSASIDSLHPLPDSLLRSKNMPNMTTSYCAFPVSCIVTSLQVQSNGHIANHGPFDTSQRRPAGVHQNSV